MSKMLVDLINFDLITPPPPLKKYKGTGRNLPKINFLIIQNTFLMRLEVWQQDQILKDNFLLVNFTFSCVQVLKQGL